MIGNILLGLFALALAANAVALYRHAQALRAHGIMMDNFAEIQREFNELVARERETQS